MDLTVLFNNFDKIIAVIIIILLIVIIFTVYNLKSHIFSETSKLQYMSNIINNNISYVKNGIDNLLFNNLDENSKSKIIASKNKVESEIIASKNNRLYVDADVNAGVNDKNQKIVIENKENKENEENEENEEKVPQKIDTQYANNLNSKDGFMSVIEQINPNSFFMDVIDITEDLLNMLPNNNYKNKNNVDNDRVEDLSDVDSVFKSDNKKIHAKLKLKQ